MHLTTNERAQRKLVHDRGIHFRANAKLVEAAETKAHSSGMTLAEFLRAAMREKVGQGA